MAGPINITNTPIPASDGELLPAMGDVTAVAPVDLPRDHAGLLLTATDLNLTGAPITASDGTILPAHPDITSLTPTQLGSAMAGVVVETGPPTLKNLTVAPPAATVGADFSGRIYGRTPGSGLTLSGAGAAGLTVNLLTNRIIGIPTTAGAVNITETHPEATNSPRTTNGVLAVSEGSVLELAPLTITLAAPTIPAEAAPGTTVATVSGWAASTVAGGRALLGTTLLTLNATGDAVVVGVDGLSAAAGTTITGWSLQETNANATNSPLATAGPGVPVNAAAVTVTLADLTWTLSAAPAQDAAPGTVIGTLSGMTAGSSLAITGADVDAGRVALATLGQVVVGAAGLSGVASLSFVPVETLAAATNSPHSSPAKTVTVNAAGGIAIINAGETVGYGSTRISGAAVKLATGVSGTALALAVPSTVMVNRPGYTVSAGTVQATTWQRTFTARYRYYDIQASNTNGLLLSPDGSDIAILDSSVWSTDTVVGATNSSTLTPRPGTAAWSHGPDLRLVGNSIQVGVVGATSWHRNRQPFAAVVFQLFDAASGTQIGTDITVSTTTARTYSNGRGVFEYRLDADVTAVPDGTMIQVRANCYPWEGGATEVISSALRTSTARNWGQFNDQIFYKRASIFSNRPVVYLKPSTGNDTTVVVGNNTMPAATLKGALVAAQTFNNANNGVNTYSGAIVRLMEDATVSWPTTGTTLYYLAGANYTIEGDPAIYTGGARPKMTFAASLAPTHTVINTGVPANQACEMKRLELVRGASSATLGSMWDFGAGAGIGAPTQAFSAGDRLCGQSGRMRFCDGSLTTANIGGATYLLNAQSDYDTGCYAMWGSTFKPLGVNNLRIPACKLVGNYYERCVMSGRDVGTVGYLGSQKIEPHVESCAFYDIKDITAGILPGENDWTGTNPGAFINIVVENTSGDNNVNCLAFSSDNGGPSIKAVYQYGITVAGFGLCRSNEAYSDNSGPSPTAETRTHHLYRRQVIWTTNAFKGAIFDKEQAGTGGLTGTAILNRDGAMEYGYGVYQCANVLRWRNNFPRPYEGPGCVTQPPGVQDYYSDGLNVGFISPQYTTEFASVIAQGAGRGDYRLSGTSAYRTHVADADDYLKCDMMGNIRAAGDAPGCFAAAAATGGVI